MAKRANPSESSSKARPEPKAVPDLDMHPNLPLALDDVVDLLDDIDDVSIPEEPDDKAITLEAAELETLIKEPLDVLDDPNLMMELSEDPVRLYLKEIGGIELLDTDREFWLSTRLDAIRRIDLLSRSHPLARQGTSVPQNIYS